MSSHIPWNDAEIDWNPESEWNPTDGDTPRGSFAPGYDSAAWEPLGAERNSHSRSRHSSQRGRESGGWDATAADDWGTLRGQQAHSQSRRSHSRGHTGTARTISNLGPSERERERNAAYYDTGRPHRQRTFNTDQIIAHPFFSPYGHFGHPAAQTAPVGWGNDDVEARDGYFDTNQHHSTKRQSSAHRSRNEHGATDDQTWDTGANTPRGGPPVNDGWDLPGGNAAQGTDNAGWGDNNGNTWATGGIDDWGNVSGANAAGWGQSGGNLNQPGDESGWGNTMGGPPLLEHSPGTSKSYKVRRSPVRSSAGSSFTFVGSSTSRGPIPLDGIPPGALERTKSDGGPGFKNLVKSLVGANGSLHPFLRPASLLRSQIFLWDIRREPHPGRSGLPLGQAVGGFNEPATDPPRQFMRVMVPIPGLGGAYWIVEVLPKPKEEVGTPIISFSFLGSPTSFGRSQLKRSKSRSDVPEYSPHIRVGDVLMQIYDMLQKTARKEDYQALNPIQREKVTKTFYGRCSEIEGADGRIRIHKPGPGTEEIDEEIDRRIKRGLRRIDFMDEKTQWEGLDSGKDPDTWIIRLGRSNERLTRYHERGEKSYSYQR